MQILTMGEILWDIIDQTEHLGGAPLNFSAAVQRLGNPVSLISGLGDDSLGRRALEAVCELGLDPRFVQILPESRTGTALVTKDKNGNASFFIERPAAFDEYRLDNAAIAAIASLQPGWIYFGTLAQSQEPSLKTLEAILEQLPQTRRFYDMNIREGHWNLPLVQHLSQHADILKLNEDEAELLFSLTRSGADYSLESFCHFWADTYRIETICVTLGGKGCAVWSEYRLQKFPGFSVTVADTVGAGDAFAAAFLHGRIQGWPVQAQATFANGLGALVASRAGAIPAWTVSEFTQLIEEQSPAAR